MVYRVDITAYGDSTLKLSSIDEGKGGKKEGKVTVLRTYKKLA